MEMTKVKSARLNAIGYDADSFTLRIEFSNGATYDYDAVEPEKFAAMQASVSKGNYFAQHIAGPDRKNPLYAYNRVPAGTPKPKLGPVAQAGLNYDAARPIEISPAPQPELLPPAAPVPPLAIELPTDITQLTLHAQSVRQRVQQLLRVEGVSVALVIETHEAAEDTGRLFVALSAEKKAAQAICDADRKPYNDAYRAGLDREKRVMENYAILDTLDRALTAYRQKEKNDRERREREARAQRQRQLDADAEAARVAAQATAHREAETLVTLGLKEEAAVVRATPEPVIAQTAAPVVYASEAPKVPGMKVVDNWKNRVDNPEQIPLYFRERILAAINRDSSNDDLVLEIGRIFCDLYTLDLVKVNGILKPKKQAGIGHIPGITAYNDQKTSTTGRG